MGPMIPSNHEAKPIDYEVKRILEYWTYGDIGLEGIARHDSYCFAQSSLVVDTLVSLTHI